MYYLLVVEFSRLRSTIWKCIVWSLSRTLFSARNCTVDSDGPGINIDQYCACTRHQLLMTSFRNQSMIFNLTTHIVRQQANLYSTTCLTRIGSAAPCSPATFGRVRRETCSSSSVSGPFTSSKEKFRMRTDITAWRARLYVKTRNESKGDNRTSNSAKANPLPRHILGPSENVSKCLWP